jgi:hypothetical protein
VTLGRGLSSESSTTIYIITPTYYRLSQKADLTRMSNTLRLVASIYWVLVEDADETSDSVSELLTQSRLPHAYIAAKTPTAFKLNESDPNWKYPRGVVQRNAALNWIRLVIEYILSIEFILELIWEIHNVVLYTLVMMIIHMIYVYLIKFEMYHVLVYGL